MRTPNLQTPKTPARRIQGQGMTEYIIVVAIIALGAVAAIGYFGTTVNASFVSMGASLVGADTPDAAVTNAAGNAAAAEGQANTARGLGEYD